MVGVRLDRGLGVRLRLRCSIIHYDIERIIQREVEHRLDMGSRSDYIGCGGQFLNDTLQY